MAIPTISDERLRSARHHRESSWLWLAVVGIAPPVVLAVIASIASFLVLPLVIVGLIFFFGRVTEARLLGSAIEVSTANFPEIGEDITYVRERLGYPKPVRAFVVKQSGIDAALWRVFGRRYISFNESLVTSLTRDERRFIVGYFVGALRSRHLRFHEASAFIEGLDKLKFLNILVLPYLRATVYSGDRFGLLAIDKPEAAFSALRKLLIGDKLSSEVSESGLAAQATALRSSIFHSLSIFFSSAPHMTDRYIELQEYAILLRDGDARTSEVVQRSSQTSVEPG